MARRRRLTHLRAVVVAWLSPLRFARGLPGLWSGLIGVLSVLLPAVAAYLLSIRVGVPIAAILVLVGLLALALWALWRAIPYPDINAEFSFGANHGSLSVVLTKGGKTLPDAEAFYGHYDLTDLEAAMDVFARRASNDPK